MIARIVFLAVAAGLAACSQRLADPLPIAEPLEWARDLQRIGTPDRSQLIVFKWRYRGSEGRFAGDGGVRVNPPDSVRLDLLGPDWSGVQSAVLVGDVVRYLGEQRVVLPPPAFMWTFLGVFRPPTGIEPRGQRRGDRAELRYGLSAEDSLSFEFDAAGRLVRAALEVEGTVVQQVEIEPGAADDDPGGWSWPREARYRDLSEFHEVRIEVTENREHARFEPRIFRVARR